MDGELQGAIVDRRPAAALREIAIRGGMRSLSDDGLRQVARGCTTRPEVLRVCLE